ncbi:ATP-dependent RecD-like DNA helicase [Prevotella sp. S7 MS 2]|uniref:ATP-dependent DNA helicase n=1 Tax=Prevotella sp. S7 MS 2 TaxID=1287488 RepID=UPI000513116A|nr:AAA family ATPase [Prevotella sp. S7 MS 2]KGI59448.1 ATP-dependent endonuclease [Prevotella sp. S7 MS 2]
MISDEIKYEIVQAFGFEPTADQCHALNVFAQFLTDRSPEAVMILRGSAGTGKTSLAGAIVRTMKKLKQRVLLLAPTGRAAKVFALNSEHEAYTIHRRIYREKVYEGLDGQFNLNRNTYRDTLFMVDESSMIANQGLGDSSFGSGRLLDDLVKFVYEGQNDRLLLIGDKAQLPPVGEIESPALSAQQLAGYGLRVYECDLDEVLRQSSESGILYNATTIRRMITLDTATTMPKLRFQGFADIVMVPGNELVDALASSYSHVGMDETTVITRSNKRANIYNQGIRGSVLDREDVLNTGDLLMIVKNNYYWVTEENARAVEGEKCSMSFIANGDRAVVLKVRNIRDLYGFSFADVLLRFPDYDDYEMQTTVVLDSLTTESPALTREQNERLYQGVMEDYADLSTKTARLTELRKDIYFNALQIKYGYSFTCHKAQGGQWSHVYIDQGYMPDDMLTPDYIHWLYTAFTRATEKLFLVNWPKSQIEEQIIK